MYPIVIWPNIIDIYYQLLFCLFNHYLIKYLECFILLKIK